MRTIPNESQDYKTIGNWKTTPYGVDLILVSNMDNDDYEFIVGVHELVEQYLCKKRGISDEAVTEFDKAHLDHENPGDLKEAPYHKEHMAASVVETFLIHELGIDLKEYEDTMSALYK